MIIVFDEDIPRAFREIFEEFNYEVLDVRDEDLRGASFVNPLRFSLKSLEGVILNRLPETLPLPRRIKELRSLLSEIDNDSLIGFITVLEPKRIRRRRI